MRPATSLSQLITVAVTAGQGATPATATLPTVIFDVRSIAGTNPYNNFTQAWAKVQVQFVTASLQAYSTACAPLLCGNNPQPANWDPQNPRYFSGTACTATATAAALSGILTHAQLCIGENGGDTVVKEYFDKSQAPSPLPSDNSINVGSGLATANLGAIFDSTHFVNASQCVLKVKVWDSNSGHYEAQLSAPVKNRLYGIANQNLAVGPLATGTKFANDTLDNIVSTAQQMNYTAVGPITDDKTAVLNTLPSYTAFFAFTHGEIGLGSCTAIDTDASQFLSPTDIQNQIAVKAVNLNLPPYNFVELDACNLGKTDDWVGVFGITRNLSGLPIQSVDRAGIAWADAIVADWNNEGWSERLWEELNNGRTLYDATILAEIECSVYAENKNFPSVSAPFLVKTTAVSIYGDSKMTLHGVYPGTSSLVTSSSIWYRPL